MASFIVIYLAVFAALVAAMITLWVVVLRSVWRDANFPGQQHPDADPGSLLMKLRRLTH